MHKLLLTLVLGILSFSAIGKANPLIASPTQDSIFKQVFHVTEGEYDLYIISTCMIGKISFGYFMPEEVDLGESTLGGDDNSLAMLEQEFIFTKNGRTIKQFFSPVRRRNATTTNGHTYSFLEIPVVTVRVFLKDNKIYYHLQGGESLGLSPDMILIYSIDGDLIVYSYQGDIKLVDFGGYKREKVPGYFSENIYRAFEKSNELKNESKTISYLNFNYLGKARMHPPYRKD